MNFYFWCHLFWVRWNFTSLMRCLHCFKRHNSKLKHKNYSFNRTFHLTQYINLLWQLNSSVWLSQSGLPSHCHSTGTQRPDWHCSSSKWHFHSSAQIDHTQTLGYIWTQNFTHSTGLRTSIQVYGSMKLSLA